MRKPVVKDAELVEITKEEFDALPVTALDNPEKLEKILLLLGQECGLAVGLWIFLQ